MKKETEQKVDIDYADRVVPEEGKKGFVTMFMIMLGFTFFSASMWAGQQLAAGLDFWGFLKSLLFGGAILGLYTGLLGYVGAKTGMSMDLLAQKAFGEKGSYLSSAMISFTQIGWFGVGIAMFAIPVAGELFGDSKTAMWALVIVAGVCMTASAYFGIDSLTVISYIAVPLVASAWYGSHGHGGPPGQRNHRGSVCNIQRFPYRCRRCRSGCGILRIRWNRNPRTLPDLRKMRRRERSQRS